jgi:PEP-CTERM motif
MSHRFATALLCIVAVASPLAAQSVSYSQGTFDPSQWGFSTVTPDARVTATEGLSANGGNPGSNWVHTWSLPQVGGTSRYRVANINSTFTYDPRVNGALASLSFAFDMLGVQSTNLGGAFGAFVPTLRQNGSIFFLLNGSAVPTTNWSTFSITSVGTTNWVDPNDQSGPLRPDFSALGTTMDFGYIYTIGTSCGADVCAAAATSSRLDNFSVTANAAVSTVPEPSTYALMAAGLGALMLVQRRRRLAA